MEAGSLLEPSTVAEGNGAEGDGVRMSSEGGSVGDPKTKLPGWTEHLPGDLKKPEVLEKLSKFERLGDLAKAWMDSQGMLERALVVPDEGASADQISEFRKKLGIPEKPDGYQLEGDSDVKEAGLDEWFKNEAHRLNMTTKQAGEFYKALLKRAGSQMDVARGDRQKRFEEGSAALKAELGEKFEETVARCRRVVGKFGGDEFANFLEENRLDNDPRLVKFIAKLDKGLSDDQLPSAGLRGEKQTSSNPFDPANWTFKS